jgi:hypothetical protein
MCTFDMWHVYVMLCVFDADGALLICGWYADAMLVCCVIVCRKGQIVSDSGYH